MATPASAWMILALHASSSPPTIRSGLSWQSFRSPSAPALLLQRPQPRLQPAAGLERLVQVGRRHGVEPLAQEALRLPPRQAPVEPAERPDVELERRRPAGPPPPRGRAARTRGSARGGRRGAGPPAAGAGRRGRAGRGGSPGTAPRPAPTARAADPAPAGGVRRPRQEVLVELVLGIGVEPERDPLALEQRGELRAARGADCGIAARQLGEGVRARRELGIPHRDEEPDRPPATPRASRTHRRCPRARGREGRRIPSRARASTTVNRAGRAVAGAERAYGCASAPQGFRGDRGPSPPLVGP